MASIVDISTEIKEAVGGMKKDITESVVLDVEKSLWEERKAYDELLKAKADGKAFSELETIVKKHEDLTNTLREQNIKLFEEKKALEDDVAELKMGIGGVQKNFSEEEVKSVWYEFVRKGNASTLDQRKREILVKSHLAENEFVPSELRRNAEEIKAMYSGSNIDGGTILVPPIIDKQIRHYIENAAALYSLASHSTVGGPVFQGAAVTQEVAGEWTGETEDKGETSALKFGDYKIDVKELVASPKLFRNLIEDAAIDVEAEVIRSAQRTFSEKIAQACILGDGVNRLRGILAHPFYSQSKAYSKWGEVGYIPSKKADGFIDPTGSVSPVDVFKDIQGVLANMYKRNASWLMNDQTMTLVRKFKDLQGQYIWDDNTKTGEPDKFLGRPIYTDPYMPDVVANAYPVLYGNFNDAYKFVTRRGLTVIRETDKASHVFIHMTMRIGGGISDFNAVKALKIATS